MVCRRGQRPLLPPSLNAILRTWRSHNENINNFFTYLHGTRPGRFSSGDDGSSCCSRTLGRHCKIVNLKRVYSGECKWYRACVFVLWNKSRSRRTTAATTLTLPNQLVLSIKATPNRRRDHAVRTVGAKCNIYIYMINRRGKRLGDTNRHVPNWTETSEIYYRHIQIGMHERT